MEKVEKLQAKISESINEVINSFKGTDKLDHFEITIKNHNGQLQVDSLIKNRVKAY